MVIVAGHPPNPISALMAGARSTWFTPSLTPRGARKAWIAGALRPAGTVQIDAGASRALSDGRSLLPAGVTGISGQFERGDLVTLHDGTGREIGRGLANYGARDARRIRGHKSHEIERILGYRGRDELIHRDDLVLSE